MSPTTSVLAVLLVAMATAQVHPDLMNPGPSQPDPVTGQASSAALVTEGSTMVPVTSSASMAPDSSANPMQTTQGDTTQAPVDVTTGADVTSAAPVDVTTTEAMSTATTAPDNYYPSIDEIIDAFKSIAHSEYFKSLSYEEQILVLELTSGGEVGKIAEVMDNIGYQRLFSFVYKIPLKYLDNLLTFILAGLEREQLLNASNSS